ADSALADLVGRTEGWPAGVYLAALSLRGHPSPGTFVRQFSGDSRYVADLLIEEVLSRQPAHIRRFLARTAILGEFSAPLSDAVLGSADAAEIIGTLERENLFVVPIDENRGWYRYQPRFSSMGTTKRFSRSSVPMISAASAEPSTASASGALNSPRMAVRARKWRMWSGWRLSTSSISRSATYRLSPLNWRTKVPGDGWPRSDSAARYTPAGQPSVRPTRSARSESARATPAVRSISAAASAGVNRSSLTRSSTM